MGERKLNFTRCAVAIMADAIGDNKLNLTDDWLTMHDAIKKWADARREFLNSTDASGDFGHPYRAAAEALAKLVEVQE